MSLFHIPVYELEEWKCEQLAGVMNRPIAWGYDNVAQTALLMEDQAGLPYRCLRLRNIFASPAMRLRYVMSYDVCVRRVSTINSWTIHGHMFKRATSRIMNCDKNFHMDIRTQVTIVTIYMEYTTSKQFGQYQSTRELWYREISSGSKSYRLKVT